MVVRCRYLLYDECVYNKVTGSEPTREDCTLCIKSYRLKHGLKSIHQYDFRGLRSGVTL